MSHAIQHQDRAYLRHPSEMPIRIHCEGQLGKAMRRLRNVSIGGLACHSEEPLEVGSEVSVEIPIGLPPFHARGAVVWCRHAHSCYELGIQFVAHEDAFAARMVEQLCYIERYRREVREKEGRELDSTSAATEWIAKYAANFPRID
ncbi:MAG: type pilus assembly PilZ [Proteobacteria bacterium]|nr:type pilus assembly PilZ [Pseudomonadota bacterium]